MPQQDSKGVSNISGFFMLFVFFFAGAFLAALIVLTLSFITTGKFDTSIISEISKANNGGMAKLVQSASAIVSFLLPALLTAYLMSRKPLKLMGFDKKIQPKEILWVLMLIIAMLALSMSLAYATELIPIGKSLKQKFDAMEQEYSTLLKNILVMRHLGDYIAALIVMALIPAICEEAFFRGGLQNYLSKAINPHLAIVIVSFIFSAMHFSYYGFLPRMGAGMVLGYIYFYSGKLWLSIVGHFINNAAAVTVVYVSLLQNKSIEDALKEDKGNAWGFLALPIIIALFMFFKKYFSEKTLQTAD